MYIARTGHRVPLSSHLIRRIESVNANVIELRIDVI